MGKKILGILLILVVCSNVFAYEFTRDVYYVKEKGSGTMDGSSWANAMSAETFSHALSPDYASKLKPGVTFHLAAGNYHPLHDTDPESHNLYTDEARERCKAYLIRVPVNIIGGYSPYPTDEEQPKPTIYKTIINGEIKKNDSEDNQSDEVYNLFCFDFTEKSQCSFYGLTLTKTTENRYVDGGAFWILGEGGAVLKIEKCTMIDLSGVFPGSKSDRDEVELTSCVFENPTNNSGGYDFNFHKAEVNSCTFIEKTSHFIADYLYVRNCTFCQISTTFTVNKDGLFHNNTVVRRGYNGLNDGFNLYYNGDVSLIGNIFDCQVKAKSNNNSTCESKHNLCINKDLSEEMNLSDNCVVDQIDVLDSDLSYDKIYYTPYFKLLSDILSDGRSVHFPLIETSAKKDQRGVDRFEKTCMGSYEKRDTIYMGKKVIYENESLSGKTYDKYGVYDNVSYTALNQDGYEYVIVCTLYVKPKDKRTNFYVKTDGTGDGSSWEKAMSPTDFAWRMLLSETIDTFHVAEGTYYPPLVENSRAYERSMPICIIGGYPKNSISLSQEPDPVKYKTILSVDFNNDNTYDQSYSTYSNNADDGYTILAYSSYEKGNSYISGIVFQGGQCVRGCTNSQLSLTNNGSIRGSKFIIEQCEFKSTSTYSIHFDDEGGTLNINNCYFNYVPAPKYGIGGEIVINASTFVGQNCYFIAQDGRKITISNCTMYDCKQIGLNMNSAPSSIIMFKNNTIYSNENTSELIYDLQPNLYLIGNIIACNFNNEYLERINSSYNVYLKPTDMTEEKIGTDLFTDDISSFLDSKLSQVDNVITPVLVMTSDTLPDGTSLRIPLSVTELTDDQRKWNRYNMTSVGSYEAECQKDSSYLTVTDTIYAGDVYMGQTFVKEGLNYGIDTLHNAMGCDSLIFHPVFVLPERNIPTAFTPFDSNNKNDVFMQGHEVYIYDVYGMLICHSENGWNGMIDEEKANPGIYVYAVKTYSGEIKRGTIELLIQQ